MEIDKIFTICISVSAIILSFRFLAFYAIYPFGLLGICLTVKPFEHLIPFGLLCLLCLFVYFFCIFVLQSCFAHACCNWVVIMFCKCVLQLCFAIVCWFVFSMMRGRVGNPRLAGRRPFRSRSICFHASPPSGSDPGPRRPSN